VSPAIRRQFPGIEQRLSQPSQQRQSLPAAELLEDPAVLVGRLEATADGCRWLLQQWTRLGQVVRDGLAWFNQDQRLALRLLGQRDDGLDSPADPRTALIRQAAAGWHELLSAEHRVSLWDGWPAADDDRPDPEPGEIERGQAELAQARADWVGLAGALQEIADGSCARLAGLLAARQAAEASDHDAAELAARASFDDSPEGERLHRYQMAWNRSLLRTLDMIWKLQQEAAESAWGDDRTDGVLEAVEADEANFQNKLSCPLVAPNPMKMESACVIVGEVRPWV
jgi:hypothetical protein